MRKKIIRFASAPAAVDLQVLQDKATDYPQSGAPTRIDPVWAARGVTNDFATTAKNPDGTALAWTKHHRDVAPVFDGVSETGEYELDLEAVAVPTEVELPDPTERAAETARVNANLARLTAQERATVAQALAGQQASQPTGGSPSNRR